MSALRRDRLEHAISEAMSKFRFNNGRENLSYIDSNEKGSAIKLLSQLRYGPTENLITSYEVKPVPRYKLFLSLAIIFLILSYVSTEFNFAKFFHQKNTRTAATAIALVTLLFSGCSSETTDILKGTVAYQQKKYRHSVSCFMRGFRLSVISAFIFPRTYALNSSSVIFLFL